ncbi:hypothetical protein GCM10009827_104830 [Dactylosporangium maewongense]|uniref:Uncharacterized protein n=1 Tax=Dactylosporangium maewongense TaxID=634393 RepID=A0ABN2CZG0_9ACTN
MVGSSDGAQGVFAIEAGMEQDQFRSFRCIGYGHDMLRQSLSNAATDDRRGDLFITVEA